MCENKEDKQTQIGFVIQRLYPEFGSDAWEDEYIYPVNDEKEREDAKESARNKFRFLQDMYPKTKWKLLEVYCLVESS